MKPRSPLRIALAVAVSALCVGLAAPPALAHPPGGSDSGSETSEVIRPSLAEAQAFVDKMITNRLDWLAAISAKVSADPHLNSALKDKITSAIAQEEAALTALKSQVDSADSASAVWADVRASLATIRTVWLPLWFGQIRHERADRAAAAKHHAAVAARLAALRRDHKAREEAARKRARRREKIGPLRRPLRSPSSERPGRTGPTGAGLTRACAGSPGMAGPEDGATSGVITTDRP